MQFNTKLRLIELMLCGVLCAGCVAGAVILKTNERPKDPYQPEKIQHKDKYIVLEQNGVDTLHKGSVTFSKYADNQYYFDCGDSPMSGSPNSIYDKMPQEDHYDEVCDDCFGK